MLFSGRQRTCSACCWTRFFHRRICPRSVTVDTPAQPVVGPGSSAAGLARVQSLSTHPIHLSLDQILLPLDLPAFSQRQDQVIMLLDLPAPPTFHPMSTFSTTGKERPLNKNCAACIARKKKCEIAPGHIKCMYCLKNCLDEECTVHYSQADQTLVGSMK